MWKYPGRLFHVIVLTLFGIWVTSKVINNFWPTYSNQKPLDKTNILIEKEI